MIATIGNVLGSLVNFALGWLAAGTTLAQKFGPSAHQIRRAQGFYRKYGRWSLLLSWLPVIGDPLTLVAGVMRERISIFLVLVTIAKLSRYVVVALLANQYA